MQKILKIFAKGLFAGQKWGCAGGDVAANQPLKQLNCLAYNPNRNPLLTIADQFARQHNMARRRTSETMGQCSFIALF